MAELALVHSAQFSGLTVFEASPVACGQKASAATLACSSPSNKTRALPRSPLASLRAINVDVMWHTLI
jgi:hypothetical protein